MALLTGVGNLENQALRAAVHPVARNAVLITLDGMSHHPGFAAGGLAADMAATDGSALRCCRDGRNR